MFTGIYLSLGSNLGDRAANLQEAIHRLNRLGVVTVASSIYETEPVGVTEPWYLNCVVGMETSLDPQAFLAGTLGLEREMGRRREKPGEARIVDIDIVLFGDMVIRENALTIPHKEMHRRRFVLEPLVEIAPSVIHPLLKTTASGLLESLNPDEQIVRKFAAVGWQ